MKIYRVKNRSMEPYLHSDDLILAKRWNCPKRGHILLINPQIDSQRLNIKRLIGLPGDRITIKEGSLWLNGRYLAEPYLKGNPASPLKMHREWVVPEETFFVLSDNRILGTEDSRYYGPIPIRYIKYHMTMRIWPLIRS